MYDYLENGDVDLLLGNSAENDSRYRVVATFDAQPYYLVTVPGSTEILDGLNMALGNIMESEPDFCPAAHGQPFPQCPAPESPAGGTGAGLYTQ